ncbi:MAG: rhodanese-like domain-containing protein [Sarcina sp.]
MKNLLILDKKSLPNIINNKNWIFLDIRSSNSYNGWQLYKEKVSGHIKGATNIYYKWSSNKNLLQNLINSKKIKLDTHLVFCYSDITSLDDILDFFTKNNFKNLHILDMKTLTLEDNIFISNYTNYNYLFPGELIASLPNENSKMKIFHTGFGEEIETSKKGHIKGSIYINTTEIEPRPLWKLASKDILTLVGKKYDLHTDDEILITGWNQMASFRLATTLLYMGIKNIKVLNGGLESLESLSYDFETTSNFILPNTDKIYKLNFDDKIILTTDTLKEKLKTDNFTLLDNRTWLEHIGEISGYTYYKKKARIPSSIYGHAGIKGPHSLEYYRNVDNTMKCKDDIETLWLSQSINLSNELAFMCGSGWRASEIYFYALVFGYTNITLYSDGWIGWSRDDSNPTETGIPK